MSETRINYAITHFSERNGYRTLTLGNQYGHFPTRESAEAYLALLRGPGGLENALRPSEMETLRVDPVECYVHSGFHWRHGGCGDAVKTVFSEEVTL